MTANTLGHIIEGVALLISIGFNGLLLHLYKEGEHVIAGYQEQNADLEHHNAALLTENTKLLLNQKPVPWNKGKGGYKLNRKQKDQIVDLLNNETIQAAVTDAGEEFNHEAIVEVLNA